MQRIMCEANTACARDAPDSGYLFCQLGTYGIFIIDSIFMNCNLQSAYFTYRYAAGYLLEKSTFTPLDAFTQSGRNGRTGESCAQIYQQCNEL